jgi:hypothetical protein
MEVNMESRTKRLRKNKTANKRKVGRNKLQFKFVPPQEVDPELWKEYEDLIMDVEVYRP